MVLSNNSLPMLIKLGLTKKKPEVGKWTHRTLVDFNFFLAEVRHLFKRVDRHQYGANACLFTIKEKISSHTVTSGGLAEYNR